MEIGVDNTVISSTSGRNPHQRQLHSLFEMQQRADGVWDMNINPMYPLPIDTKLRMLDFDQTHYDEYDNDGNIIPPPANSPDGSAPLKYINLEPPVDNIVYQTVANNPNNHGYFNQSHNAPLNVYCLDLCGGKGGDLFKYTENHLGGYVLADIAKKSVEKAIERFNECFDPKKKKFRKLFFAKFVVSNLCYHSMHEFLHPKISFDMVSLSYAFHYAFETEATLRRMLQNISDRLRPGGCFVCTVPDARVLLSRLKSTNELQFGNDLYTFDFKPTIPLLNWLKSNNPATFHDYLYTLDPETIYTRPELLLWLKLNLPNSQFETTYYSKLKQPQIDAFIEYEEAAQNTPHGINHTNNNLNIDKHIADRNPSTYSDIYTRPEQPPSSPFHSFSPFGIEYRFTLKEAVDDVPEFVVLYPTLCQIAAEYGLKPLYHQNAQTFVAHHFQETLKNVSNRDLLKRLNVFEMKDFERDSRMGKNYNNHDGNNDSGSAGSAGSGYVPPFQHNQWEAVGVYCSMMFQKVGEIQFQGKTVYYDDISLTQSFGQNDFDFFGVQHEIRKKIQKDVRNGHYDDIDCENLTREAIIDKIFGCYNNDEGDNYVYGDGNGEHGENGENGEHGEHDENNQQSNPNFPLTHAQQLQSQLHSLETDLAQRFQELTFTAESLDVKLPTLLTQYETLPTTLHPDPLSAGRLLPSDPYWNAYPTPLGTVPIEAMINCFDDQTYDQSYTPAL
jgi:SAM-dependent methyltransferase